MKKAKAIEASGQAVTGALKDILEFPYATKPGTNVCSQLDADNRCSVYDTRPEICNIRKSFDNYRASASLRAHYVNNAKECNKMMDEDKSGAQRIAVADIEAEFDRYEGTTKAHGIIPELMGLTEEDIAVTIAKYRKASPDDRRSDDELRPLAVNTLKQERSIKW